MSITELVSELKEKDYSTYTRYMSFFDYFEVVEDHNKNLPMAFLQFCVQDAIVEKGLLFDSYNESDGCYYCDLFEKSCGKWIEIISEYGETSAEAVLAAYLAYLGK